MISNVIEWKREVRILYKWFRDNGCTATISLQLSRENQTMRIFFGII
jgi:hypothetical protein